MTGGLMQLVAYGAQDVYLTGNPQITFFKAVYRRHSNFSVEPIKGTVNSGNFKFGSQVTFTIARNGDLVHKQYLHVELSATQGSDGVWQWADNLGYNLIDEIELEIGGQKIDKFTGQWMYIWNVLAGNADSQMINGVEYNKLCKGSTTSHKKRKLYIPLTFFYNENIGNALPLIALQYHEVKIKVTLAPVGQCVYVTKEQQSSFVGSIDKFELVTDSTLR